jgi:hypothetical protein
MRKGLCNCLVVYDWKGDLDPKEWYRIAVEFFEALGVEPDTGSFGPVSPKKRPIQFKTLKKRIIKANSSSIGNIALHNTIPDYVQLIFGWTVTAQLIASDGKTTFFCFDDSLRSFHPDFMKDIMSKISALCEVVYGVAYQRPFELGPDAYALGMGAGMGYSTEDMARSHRIGDWFRERMRRNRHVQGLLRDVYPLNFLSRPHLENPVDGQPLAEWIAAAAGRGELAPMADGVWCWSVPPESLEGVRAILRPRGLLIAGHPETGDHD